MTHSGNGSARKNHNSRITLRKHLESMRAVDLRDVYAFWRPDEPTNGLHKPDLVSNLHETMAQEGTVYRRVRTLTRKVLDVLLLMLRRPGYASDLPGMFQRLPGEEPLALEYHEAEAGIRALVRRGFLAQISDRKMATNGRVVFSVPEELGTMLTALFREETRTVHSVFTLRGHAAAITAAERERLRGAFPALGEQPGEDDARILLKDGPEALLERLEERMQRVMNYVVERGGGFMTRALWSARKNVRDVRWNRERWARELEGAGIGTVARLSLKPYGVNCEDECVVVFQEVLEELLRRRNQGEPPMDETLRSGGDLVADLCAFLQHVGRHPVKVGRKGEVHKASRRRLQDGFVYRETFLAGPAEVWGEIIAAAESLGLVRTDKEGFLELTDEAQQFLAEPLEAKAQALYRVALDHAGTHNGRSLHLHEIRKLVTECLREEPQRWWSARALSAVSRHRHLATLDERGIKDRHRDRHFSAWFSGKESPRDLLSGTEHRWLKRLHMLGLLDVAAKEERAIAWRLSPLGARVLGATAPGLDTGLRPLLVNPDFEIVVLPEGDVSDVVHTLDGWAQRVKSGDVVHFRLTRESVQTAVGTGHEVEDLLGFLAARARGAIPQNVGYTVRDWASRVSFASLERGVVLRVDDEAALETILQIPEMERLLHRRLTPQEALLKEAPSDRRLVSALRGLGVYLQGP